MHRCVSLPLLVLFVLLWDGALIGRVPPSSQEHEAARTRLAGHADHQAAFDRGPREKPWVIEGIGTSHFPITTSHPQVQQWFDQGHTLIHSFWYYEAERAFKWCLKLDPHAAMAYWGLARAYYWRARDIDREAAFMREASKRKDRVSDRERMYIEAWEELYTPDAIAAQKAGGAAAGDVRRRLHARLEQITRKYPDDLEAKALLAWEGRGVSSREDAERLLQQVLAKRPDHPGAHHYRIHIWDGRDAERSRDSAAAYSRIVTGIGHALHMPGHTYSVLGLWHDAADAMVAANRVELDYLRQRMTLPFHSWNYAHNRNYLSYLQEQLGMAEAAIAGARELLAAPLDPTYNNPDEYGTHWQGMLALVRALIKFERWEDLLAPATTRHWRPSVRDRMWRAYAEALAHLGLGNVEQASRHAAVHAALRGEIDTPADRALGDVHAIQSFELRAGLALARGDLSTAVTALAGGAPKQAALLHQSSNNDPPVFPNLLYVVLGRAHLTRKNPSLALTAFEEALRAVPNDGFALAGLIEAYAALGKKDEAGAALARVLLLWSDADPDLKCLQRLRALGLAAPPQPTTSTLRRRAEASGAEWQPYDAPALQDVDSTGRPVLLERYRGRNVLLIFSLGGGCEACLQQLRELSKRREAFARLGTDVLVISPDSVEAARALQEHARLPFRLLADAVYANARRFQAYDDFEERPLNGIVLIDRKGRVHWSRSGDRPFEDFDFLLEETRRLNDLSARTGPRHQVSSSATAGHRAPGGARRPSRSLSHRRR